MNRAVHADDWTGAMCFHAEEIAPDDWRWTGIRYSGLLRGNREHVITALANEILTRRKDDQIVSGVLVLHSDTLPHQVLDQLGNTWIEHEYMAPDRYLPLLIPEARAE